MPELLDTSIVKSIAPFSGTKLFDVELASPLPSLGGERSGRRGYKKAIALVRLHGTPLGQININFKDRLWTPARLADQIWRSLGDKINKHLAEDGMDAVGLLNEEGLNKAGMPRCLEAPEVAPGVTVVVATKDRPEFLKRCLDSLSNVEYPNFEIIVVDNAPRSGKTADLVCNECIRSLKDKCGEKLRYVCEPQAGVSRARNMGIREAQGEIIAFVDDDVVVDPRWLWGIVHGFQSAPGVDCVTGLILPAELETQAQEWFEQYGGFCRGYDRRVFDLHTNVMDSPLYPYNAGAFGAGASMAFRAETIRDVGGFDISLGPGTPAKGAEDLDSFLRVILSGGRLVYEPAALARHYHRRQYRELRGHLRAYGIGLAAMMTKYLLNRQTRGSVMKRLPLGAMFLLSPRSEKNAAKTPGFPRMLTLLELAGIVAGPPAYLRSLRRSAPERRIQTAGAMR